MGTKGLKDQMIDRRTARTQIVLVLLLLYWLPGLDETQYWRHALAALYSELDQ